MESYNVKLSSVFSYSARFKRLHIRRGGKKATLAVAHSILKSIYHILKYNIPYKELGADYLNEQMEEKRRKYLKKELEKMGYEVSLTAKELLSNIAN
jgi:hypothetical protein